MDHVGSAFRLHAESNHFPRLPPWPHYHLLMRAPACHANLASCSVVFTRRQVAFLEHSADQATPGLGPPVASQLPAHVHPLPSLLQPLFLLFPHPYPPVTLASLLFPPGSFPPLPRTLLPGCPRAHSLTPLLLLVVYSLSHVQLLWNPRDCSLPGSSVHAQVFAQMPLLRQAHPGHLIPFLMPPCYCQHTLYISKR